MKELIFTSAPQGLDPGSRGFTTVAASHQLNPALKARLEKLSSYPLVFELGDPKASLSPVGYSYVYLKTAAQTQRVISRRCMTDADYTGRSNTLAHHLVIEPQERTHTDPAWLASQPDLFATHWPQDKQPHYIDPPRDAPKGRQPAAVCKKWEQITGDAGWGGALVRHASQNSKYPAYIIYQPGQDILPLICESMALLPANKRWAITFDTYFTHASPDITCRWRCVLKGTDAADIALKQSHAMVLDLTQPMSAPAEDDYTLAARHGMIYEPAPQPVEIPVVAITDPNVISTNLPELPAHDDDQLPDLDELAMLEAAATPSPRHTPATTRTSSKMAIQLTPVRLLAAAMLVLILLGTGGIGGFFLGMAQDGTDRKSVKKNEGPSDGTAENQTAILPSALMPIPIDKSSKEIPHGSDANAASTKWNDWMLIVARLWSMYTGKHHASDGGNRAAGAKPENQPEKEDAVKSDPSKEQPPQKKPAITKSVISLAKAPPASLLEKPLEYHPIQLKNGELFSTRATSLQITPLGSDLSSFSFGIRDNIYSLTDPAILAYIETVAQLWFTRSTANKEQATIHWTPIAGNYDTQLKPIRLGLIDPDKSSAYWVLYLPENELRETIKSPKSIEQLQMPHAVENKKITMIGENLIVKVDDKSIDISELTTGKHEIEYKIPLADDPSTDDVSLSITPSAKGASIMLARKDNFIQYEADCGSFKTESKFWLENDSKNKDVKSAKALVDRHKKLIEDHTKIQNVIDKKIVLTQHDQYNVPIQELTILLKLMNPPELDPQITEIAKAKTPASTSDKTNIKNVS